MPNNFEINDFPKSKEKQIEWIKELANNEKATDFFKRRASKYYTNIIELQKLWYKQEGECALCGDKIYFDETTHIDHISPRKLGGENIISNYQFTCARCNYAKRDMPTEDFLIMCIKVQTKNKYTLPKMKIMKILNNKWKYDDKEVRQKWEDQYKKLLKENNGNIL